MKMLIAVLLLALASPTVAAEKEKIAFPSIDGLRITADLYRVHEDPEHPFLVLFHQRGYSRGEYLEIAPKLNQLGFNCMAVDQRSGAIVNDVQNETVERAVKEGLGTTYVDALPDIVAALKHAREKYAKGKLVAWGSSYSASLVLKVAGDYPELVDGVLAFSPGEYFERLDKPADWIASSAKNIQQPVFITSARKEGTRWEAIFEAIPSKRKVSYLPETAGKHGSSALLAATMDSAGYWKAVTPFLNEHFQKQMPVDVPPPKDDGDDG